MKIKFTDFQREFNLYKKHIVNSINKVGKSGEYVFGSELIKFEKSVKKFLNVKYALGVGNWTEGMVMVCKALDLKKNDEIITVSNSFIATCGAISYYGSKPVLVDVDDTLNIDVNLIEKKINKNTKAIMPVHLSGIPSNLDKIKKICKKRNLIFIEDAAHAFGGEYKNKQLGTIGDIGIFSLHPRKNFHVFGDGGLIVTNNKKFYEKLKLIRNHGLKNRNEASIWGTNSRLDNLQASFGNFFLKKINKINSNYLKIANYYNKHLKGIVITPKYDLKISSPTFHQYIIRVKSRNQLRKYLFKQGIETAIHYPIPIHKQKAYLDTYGKVKLKKTELFSKQILSLPINNFITKTQQDYIINNIKNFYKLTN